MRAGEHNQDCDVTIWDFGSPHEHVWEHDFLRQRCANALEVITDQDRRNETIVQLRLMDAFHPSFYLYTPKDEREAFAAILLANQPRLAYQFADTCRALRGRR